MTLQTNKRFIKIGLIALILLIPTLYALEKIRTAGAYPSLLSSTLYMLYALELLCVFFFLGVYGYLARLNSFMSNDYIKTIAKKQSLDFIDSNNYRGIRILKSFGIWVEQDRQPISKNES